MKNPFLNATGFDPEDLLSRTHQVILPSPNGHQPPPIPEINGVLRVGVDLGTTYTVLVVLDAHNNPVAGEYRFTQIVRDGLVVDYIGAVRILREMKHNLESRLGRTLTHAASGYPPGVPQAEVQSTANVVEAAGMICTSLVDEASAANNVLGLKDGVIVDIGGGTTGIAVLQAGQVVHTADEATGGTHMSLVIAGGADISFEAAEVQKTDRAQQSRLFPIVRPVMEKMATIIVQHIRGFSADSIVLVGGSSLFPGIDRVIEAITGLPTRVTPHPLFVTPVGIAMNNQAE
ncbi:MAG TPA: ethanolamine utilization protein EutJ [Brevefilum sp.]|nr:ethanolamine utilization protein EutJ [Brevefilum sp.]